MTYIFEWWKQYLTNERRESLLFPTQENKSQISEAAMKCSVYYMETLNGEMSDVESDE